MLDWAGEEGWNPGLDDAAAFHAADPAGFFVATMDGSPVAAISVVNHSSSFAFLGLYLCRSEYRGRGLGYGLWSHALKHAQGRTIGLDGVPAQEANYAKSGFKLTDRTVRFQGRVDAGPFTLPLATHGDAEELAVLDTTACGFARPAFLRVWTEHGPTRKTVCAHEEDRLIGFATARLCREGCKIGPVVAPTADAAWHLVRQAAASIGQTEVILDVPQSKHDLVARLAGNGFAETFVTARMFRGPPPVVGHGLCAIATMELG